MAEESDVERWISRLTPAELDSTAAHIQSLIAARPAPRVFTALEMRDAYIALPPLQKLRVTRFVLSLSD